MQLFALTEVTQFLLLAGFVGCLILMGHVLLSTRAPRDATRERRKWFLLATGATTFLAAWVWLTPALGLLAWAAWIGDNDHWYWRANIYVSAAIALAYAASVVGRVLLGNVHPGFLGVHFRGSAILLLLFGVFLGIEFAGRIDGATPRAAAERYLRNANPPGELHVREASHSESAALHPSRCKTFWIYDDTGPRGQIRVCPYGKFWWSIGSSQMLPPSSLAIQDAKELLQDPSRRDDAVSSLKRIVEHYPGTEAADEAKRLLTSAHASR